jgi:hypothetical protein
VAAFAPEWVADLLRNQWPVSFGISGRFGPEYAFRSAALFRSLLTVSAPTHLMPWSLGRRAKTQEKFAFLVAVLLRHSGVDAAGILSGGELIRVT